jgi:hypothetical protein
MTPYRTPPAPQWPIAPSYEGGPPVERKGSSTRRFVAILWTSLNFVAIAVASLAAYLASVTMLVDGGIFSVEAWLPAAGARGGTCVAAAALLAIGLFPANFAIFRWIYRPERSQEPQRLALMLVALVAVASMVGLAQSAAAHVR